jgi:hypothetical protein
MPASVLPPTQSRRAAAAPSAPSLSDRESRSVGIGVACTILFHVLLLCLAPFFPAERITGVSGELGKFSRPDPTKDFDFQLAEDVPDARQPDPYRFVETNPDAPENEPDKTVNISNRNQQSAQEEKPAALDPENRPSIKGRDDILNDSAIVSGDMARPQDGAAAALLRAALEGRQPQAAQQARAEQVPLSGHEKFTGDSPDGVGSSVSQSKSPATNAEEFVEGAKDGRSTTGALTQTEQVNRPTPRERPRLTQARPTVLSNRITGTSNIGIHGLDARWGDYGDYMKEFIDIVQTSWWSILRDSRVSPKSGSSVVVTFTLSSNGSVSIVSVEETAGTAGAFTCTTAITSRQPYRKWTDQMVAVLGEKQTMTFQFYFF